MISALPRVLVLLASRNGAPWIQAQLDSIINQRGVVVSIVVQDDCSSDQTCEIVESKYCIGPHAVVRLIRNSTPTGSAGGNFKKLFREIEFDSFAYIALADQDDLWLPNKLELAVRALSTSNAKGYSAAVEAFWPDGKEGVLSQVATVRGADFLFEGAGQGCSFVIPKETFAKVQDFCRNNVVVVNQFHYHDWMIYLLVRAWGEQWIFDPVPGMRYRQHAGNEIGARGSLNSVLRRLKLLRDGWYRVQVSCALKVYALAGGGDRIVGRFSDSFAAPDSVRRRLYLMFFSLIHSRRRLGDRCALLGFSLLGWL